MKTIIGSLLFVVMATVNVQAAPVFGNLNVTTTSKNLTLINPLLSNLTGTAHVTFTNKNVELVIKKAMPRCADGMFCIQMMPAPVRIRLDVIRVVENECSITYVATTPDSLNSKIKETVTITDLTFSRCAQPMYITNLPQSAGVLAYEATGVSPLTKGIETAYIQFAVIGSFVRAKN
jgi:hypothetical protein